MRKTITIDLPELQILQYPSLRFEDHDLPDIVSFLMLQAKQHKVVEAGKIYRDAALLLEALRIALVNTDQPSTPPPYNPDYELLTEDGRAILGALRELSDPLKALIKNLPVGAK